jgi:hypothetical protein
MNRVAKTANSIWPLGQSKWEDVRFLHYGTMIRMPVLIYLSAGISVKAIKRGTGKKKEGEGGARRTREEEERERYKERRRTRIQQV